MTVSQEELLQVRQEAECLWTESQVEGAIAQVAEQITRELGDRNPLLLCVMKGGVVFTSSLMLKLNFPLELDYIHATRYGNETTGTTLQWKVSPHQKLAGRSVLIVDDILDEGYTLKAIVEACRAQGAERVETAVLIDKRHDRKCDPAFRADYTALETEDRYLFGYGMDYKSYWRNAAGIFAVKGL